MVAYGFKKVIGGLSFLPDFRAPFGQELLHRGDLFTCSACRPNPKGRPRHRVREDAQGDLSRQAVFFHLGPKGAVPNLDTLSARDVVLVREERPEQRDQTRVEDAFFAEKVHLVVVRRPHDTVQGSLHRRQAHEGQSPVDAAVLVLSVGGERHLA